MPDAFDAKQWLDAWLGSYPWSTSHDAAASALIAAASSLSTPARLALLKEAVARLPELRRVRDDRLRWYMGSAVYELVCRLYGSRLKYSEQDICELLHASKHDCGHGKDV